jgi:hypothetical protein
MDTEKNTVFVSVELPLPFIHGLLALAHLMDNTVASALHAAIEAHKRVGSIPEPKPPLTADSKGSSHAPHEANLQAEILGQQVQGVTLADLFARCVDAIHDLDPSAIVRLSERKTHARRYVARRPGDIHLKSPHLETIETRSGWWISANVSEQQVTTAMRLLAEASHLTFGKDFLFPLPASRCAALK